LIFFSSLMHGPRQRRVICIVQDGKGKSTGQQTANLNLSHQHCDSDSTICTAHGFEAFGRLHAKPLPADHLGWTLGSPPGLPGGGITGVLPAFGVGALIAGSTSGGQMTPAV
jgi:hypothetical protein